MNGFPAEVYQRNETMKKKILPSLILIVALLAASAFCTASCTLTGGEDKTSAKRSDDFTGCLFIGDSRTCALEMTDSLPGADFFCKEGWTVFGAASESIFIDGGIYDLRARLSSRDYDKVYVLLGINEIGGDLDAVTEKYSELISTIRSFQPEAKVIIQANPHVTTARSSQGDAVNNANVDLLNQKLRSLTDGTAVFWLDANQILDGETGGLNEAYAEADGLHPNRDCCIAWGRWILSQNGNF